MVEVVRDTTEIGIFSVAQNGSHEVCDVLKERFGGLYDCWRARGENNYRELTQAMGQLPVSEKNFVDSFVLTAALKATRFSGGLGSLI